MADTIVLRLDEGGELASKSVADGEVLLDALRALDARVDSPCGGKGRCGKCRVRASGALAAPGPEETRRLSAAELEAGWRLACLARVSAAAGASIEVRLPAKVAANVLTEAPTVDLHIDPPARRVVVELAPPHLERQVSDSLRITEALRGKGLVIDRVGIEALRSLAVHARGDSVAAIVAGGELRAVAAAAPRDGGPGLAAGAGQTLAGTGRAVPPSGLGLAVDIGTTTIAAYLLDLASGAILGVESALNSQRAFGADVISRIAAASEGPARLAELRDRVVEQISEMAHALLRRRDAGPDLLASVVVAGNSTMTHLFAGVSPTAIAAAPFPPAFAETLSFPAPDLGLDLPAGCTVWILPAVSGYVGADIVSGMMALGMREHAGTALLLDIGTNGEMALGGRDGIYCCATAAGPAFEGAGIEMGMGGVAGAVDAVWLEGDKVLYTTIGGAPAAGLCGSGVLDALATFLEAGLVDSTGRIADIGPDGRIEDDPSGRVLPPSLVALRSEGPSGPRLAVAETVWLSQADVRNLQLAVAAIAAGIDILLARAGKAASEVDEVWLAGGFGSYLNLRSAIRVGLIPRAMGERVVVVGNSSGAGAMAACLSVSRLDSCASIAAGSSYIELSSSPEFNDAYMEHMMFPEP